MKGNNVSTCGLRGLCMAACLCKYIYINFCVVCLGFQHLLHTVSWSFCFILFHFEGSLFLCLVCLCTSWPCSSPSIFFLPLVVSPSLCFLFSCLPPCKPHLCVRTLSLNLKLCTHQPPPKNIYIMWSRDGLNIIIDISRDMHSCRPPFNSWFSVIAALHLLWRGEGHRRGKCWKVWVPNVLQCGTHYFLDDTNYTCPACGAAAFLMTGSGISCLPFLDCQSRLAVGHELVAEVENFFL